MRPHHLIAAIALLFFLLPLGLRAAGMTATTFENRPFAPAPSPSAGWGVFDQTTRFFTDRMPLREQAVRVQSWTARNVLDVPPAWRRDLLADQANTAALPQDKRLERERPADARQAGAGRVLEGKDGWRFLGDDLGRACRPAQPPAAVIDRLERVARGLRASGRDVVIAIAPDKSTVYPELLGDRPRQRFACAARNRREYWPLIEASPDLLALRGPLLAAKAGSREALYRSTDSHWNTLGASIALRAILDRLDAGVRVAAGEIVRRPPLRYTGDLDRLLGITDESTTPDRAVRRRAGARKLSGRTLFVSDSYGLYDGPMLVPYATRLTQLAWPTTDTVTMIAAVEAADRVIIQIVERELLYLFAGDVPFDGLLAALESGRLPRPTSLAPHG